MQHSTLYGDAMRIAILADIHGNVLKRFLPISRVERWTSMSTSATAYLVRYGPRETAELLIRLGWPTVRGNHDCWVTDCPPEKHYRSDAFAYQALDSYHNQLA